MAEAKVSVSVRLSPTMYEGMRRVAKTTDTSITWVIIKAIDEYLEASCPA
ncbi:MAG TPA: hypothetical protein VNV87_04560 [Acidimicrobiales bacterium]|jgi:predicted transcriptional regulator|nr:hypothetical protein [Acidimicrobiales bacterium]